MFSFLCREAMGFHHSRARMFENVPEDLPWRGYNPHIVLPRVYVPGETTMKAMLRDHIRYTSAMPPAQTGRAVLQ